MKKLISIIKKNFLVTISSRLSLVLMFGGPIFLMLLVGAGLSDSGLGSVEASIYYSEDTEFTEAFSQALIEDSFILTKTSSLEECKDNVRSSGKNLCIEVRKNDVDIPDSVDLSKSEMEKAGVGYSVDLFPDFSKPRTVWGIISRVRVIVEGFSDRIRGASSDKVRDKFDEFSNMVDESYIDVHGVISKLEVARDKIKESYEILPNVTSNGKIENQISSIRKNLNTAKSLIPPEYDYLFNPLFSDLDTLETAFENGGYNLIPKSRVNIKNQIEVIDQIITKLEYIKDDLEEISKESDEIGELNWNYVLHPIPLNYGTISGDNLKSDNTELTFIDYLFPSLISFFVLLISFFISVNLISREKSSDASIRNSLSKASKFTFFFANFITIFVIVLVQIILLVLIASPFLSFSIFSNTLFFFCVLLISVPFFIVLGMIFGELFENQETSILVSISAAIVFIVFSSLITPSETLPGLIKEIVSYSPLVVMETLFRRLFVFNSNLSQNLFLILLQAGITFITFWFSVFVFYLGKRKR